MPAPASVAEVIARIHEVEESARPSDGVVCFARLYRTVTEAVWEDLGAGAFATPRFLEQLDVVFANLFLTAVETNTNDPSRTPSAWVPLFADRSRHGIAPIQFAFAGMNAHINGDLPVALVATCRELGVDLAAGGPQHADFERVNDVLAQVETRVKASLLSGLLATIDRIVHRYHRLDDVIAMWQVRRARDAAWTNAQALWALRDDPPLSAEFVEILDRTVGFAGRGLLVPADTLLRRVARALAP